MITSVKHMEITLEWLAVLAIIFAVINLIVGVKRTMNGDENQENLKKNPIINFMLVIVMLVIAIVALWIQLLTTNVYEVKIEGQVFGEVIAENFVEKDFTINNYSGEWVYELTPTSDAIRNLIDPWNERYYKGE